jgi:hypothetical protein
LERIQIAKAEIEKSMFAPLLIYHPRPALKTLVEGTEEQNMEPTPRKIMGHATVLFEVR